MKAVIMKVGSTITLNKDELKTVAKYEAYYIAEMLKEYFDFVTFIDKNISTYREQDYDAVFILGGVVNVFGGVYRPEYFLAHHIINQTKNIPVFYIFEDIKLPLAHVHRYIDRFEQLKDLPVDIRDNKNIILLSQGRDLKKAKDRHKDISFKDIIHFNTAQWPLFMDYDDDLSKETNFALGVINQRNKEYSNTISELLKNLKHPYELYGNKLRRYDLKHLDIKERIPFNKYIERIKKAYTTLVVMHPWYYDNMPTSRIYEAIQMNTIPLIYYKCDTNHSILDDPYFYIETEQELQNKIQDISSMTYQQYTNLIVRLHAALNTSLHEISDTFYNTIKKYLQ
jgi:hypothetical protein